MVRVPHRNASVRFRAQIEFAEVPLGNPGFDTCHVRLPVPPAPPLTVAVNVTDCPTTDGLTDEVTTVDVGDRASVTV